MIKIRKGVFETNSSSTHVMVICNDKTKIPENISIEFITGGFGWGFADLTTLKERASYLYTALVEAYSLEEAKEIIEKHLLDYNIKCSFNNPIKNNYGWYDNCYIDHGPEWGFVQAMTHDKEVFLDFLFNDNSHVVTGNDNCDDDEYCWFSERSNPETKYNPGNNYTTYYKGN